MSTLRTLALLALTSIAPCACFQGARPPAPGYHGPLPSTAARGVLRELEGERLVDALGGLDPAAPGRAYSIGAFGVVPDPLLGKGPVVRLTGAAAHMLPVLGDGDVADLFWRVRGRRHAQLGGELSQPYRQALGLVGSGEENRSVRLEHGAGAVILPAWRGEQVRWLGYQDAVAYWTPTPAQVAVLESGLRAALERGLERPETLDDYAREHPDFADWLRGELTRILARLDDYRRQYVGVIDARGRKRILTRCFAGPAFGGGFDFERWTDEIVVVSDGGCWYWRIDYDVESGEFSDFDSNGYA